jgi:hypothetical protein
MSQNQSGASVVVQAADDNVIDDLFNSMPGSDNIINDPGAGDNGPDDLTEPKNLLSKPTPSAIDQIFGDTPRPAAVVKGTVSTETDELLNDITGDASNNSDENGGDPDQKDTGGKTGSKTPLVNFIKKGVEAGTMQPFDDYDAEKSSLDEYLASLTYAELEELLEANSSLEKTQLKETVEKEFLENLPREMQYALRYIAEGGTDMQTLFASLAQAQQLTNLDVSNAEHHSEIARQYLHATNYGTPEEIEQEISDWEKAGVLNRKAAQFKPKLDAMQDQILQDKVAEQARAKQKAKEQTELYFNNVYEALKPGLIGEVKIDKRMQQSLYDGLTQFNFPSKSGKMTNELGHLIEKHQFEEPNLALLAEAQWLLRDPEGYRAELLKLGSAKSAAEAQQELNKEQSRKLAGSGKTAETTGKPATVEKKVSKPAITRSVLSRKF